MTIDENIVTTKDTVRVRYPDGKIREFRFIANHNELDPVNGRISTECPIGRALLGAKNNEKRKYCVGVKEFEVEVLEVIKSESEVKSK